MTDEDRFQEWHRRECPQVRNYPGTNPCHGNQAPWGVGVYFNHPAKDQDYARFRGRTCREVYAQERPGREGVATDISTENAVRSITKEECVSAFSPPSARDEALEEAARIAREAWDDPRSEADPEYIPNLIRARKGER